MRDAIRQLDNLYSGGGEANTVEPPRGPAQVTQLPLNPMASALSAGSGAAAGVDQLKTAMMLAGLSDGR
jgi:hypothetical protein